MRKVLSIILAVVLFASHANVTFGTHFCGGMAVKTKIILGETHLDCSMIDMEESCDVRVERDYSEDRFEKAPCCENEYHSVQTTDEFVKDAALQFLNVDFAAALIFVTLSLDLFPSASHQFYTDYIPPLVEKDLPVLFQTFLI